MYIFILQTLQSDFGTSECYSIIMFMGAAHSLPIILRRMRAVYLHATHFVLQVQNHTFDEI